MKNNKKNVAPAMVEQVNDAEAPVMVEQNNSPEVEVTTADNVRNGRQVNLRSADWLANKENEINAGCTVDGASVKLSAAYDYADTEDTAVYYDGELKTGHGDEVIEFSSRRIGWLSSKLGLPTNPRNGNGLKSLVNCTEEELEKIALEKAARWVADACKGAKYTFDNFNDELTDANLLARVGALVAARATMEHDKLSIEQAQQKANLENKQRNKSVATASNETMISELLRRGLITEEQAAAMRAAAA